MDSPKSICLLSTSLMSVALFLSTFGATPAVAQTSDRHEEKSAAADKAKAAKGDRQAAKDKSPDKKAAAAAAQKPAKGRNAPTAEYEESIRRTVERRRERRARRAQGLDQPLQPGAIVPWPMPPALIIRQTRETHDEIDSFLSLLRR